MGVYVAGDAPAMDRRVSEAIKAIGGEIDSLRVPRLQGVVLGGGYGRGEGGVRSLEFRVQSSEFRAPGSELGGGEVRVEEALSNDLDFFAVTEEGASASEIAVLVAALEPVSRRWTERLGVDVDFTVRTPWRLRHDQARVMIQELIHGYFDVAGKKGAEMFKGIEVRPPSAFPWSEAVRLLVNRGVGLLLAHERMSAETTNDQRPTSNFILRNINKCVLGAGDARLIARGGYLWKAEERAAALGEPLYSAAVAWKFRPRKESVCSWEEAQAKWLEAVDEVMSAGRRTGAMRRTVYQMARWIWRRRTVGDLTTLGYGAVVRILLKLAPVVRMRAPLPPSLRRDWEVFN